MAHYLSVVKRLASLGVPVFQKMLVTKTLPLRVGIHVDLAGRVAPQDRQTARRLLANLVNSHTYLRALAAKGSRRHDLEGQPVAEVSDDEREFARQRLRMMMRARKAKAEARAKAEVHEKAKKASAAPGRAGNNRLAGTLTLKGKGRPTGR